MLLVACTWPRGAEPTTNTDQTPTIAADGGAIAEVSVAQSDDEWTTRYDFDGDGRPDRIDVSFSGGAHCCYLLAVHTSKNNRVVAIPFEIDGGYVGGLSLAQPGHFDIKKGRNGVARFQIQIAVYGGRPRPIPAKWTNRFGIHTHSIEVEIRSGRLRALDRQ